MFYKRIFFLLLLISFSLELFSQQRIVSLAPSITESLFELGVGDKIVGVTSYCQYPPTSKKKTVIGDLASVNIELIYSLKPDMIIALSDLNRPQYVTKLKSLGLKVIEFTEGNSYQELKNNFLNLAKLVGKETIAKEKIKNFDSEVQAIYNKCKGLKKKSVFFEFGDQPLVTLGTNTFANDYLKFTSSYNIFSEMTTKYPKINREDVIKRDPDIILIITMGLATEREVNYWKQFKNMKAVKNNCIYVVDSDIVCRPTPMSFIKSLKEIIKIIHPEINK